MNAFGITQSLHSWYGIAIMTILGGLSVYTMALWIVRYKFFKKIRVDSKKLLEDLHKAITNNDSKVITELRGQRATDPPVRILMSTALINVGLNQGELQDLFNVTRIQQRERVTKHLSKFSTMATIAPFMGLLGTVMGIIEAFNALAQSGAAGPNVVASGVAAALWTTAAGLIVAIPSVVAFTLFRGKALSVLTELEIVGRELMLLFKLEKVSKMKL